MVIWCFIVWLNFNGHWQHIPLSHLFWNHMVATVDFIISFLGAIHSQSSKCKFSVLWISECNPGAALGTSEWTISQLAIEAKVPWSSPSRAYPLGSLNRNRGNQEFMATTGAKYGHVAYVLFTVHKPRFPVCSYIFPGWGYMSKS